MSISTLKTAKVGDKVTMLTFTGMNLGQFAITKAGKSKVAILKKDGTQAEFSRETGLQTNADNPKYANKIVDPIAEPVKKTPAKPEKKAEAPAPKKKAAPAPKKVEKVEIEDDADDFEDDDLDDEEFEEFDEE